MIQTADIAIVGGGAAGLAAAIFAAEAAPQARVVVLDGAARLGAKILVSGGGRCNVTHEAVEPGDYQGNQRIIRRILSAFDETRARNWLESLGVSLKREPTGKLFPVTNSAETVLEALLGRCSNRNVQLLTGHRVEAIGPGKEAGFNLAHAHGALTARRLILSTGGRSLPKTGSDGGGYLLARAMGHHVTETHPALVPLMLEKNFFHASLSGISHEAELASFSEGRCIDRRRGSLLWTHFGISGPLAMDASRFWTVHHAAGREPKIFCSFFPGQEFSAIEKQWLSVPGATSLIAFLTKTFPLRLIETLLQFLKIDPAVQIARLSREDRRMLVHALCGLELPVTGARGWNYAEVTAGGVPLEEIEPGTMASRKTPGLFLAGEILDCEGRIGGFNFQWAWATGHIAGRQAAASLSSSR